MTTGRSHKDNHARRGQSNRSNDRDDGQRNGGDGSRSNRSSASRDHQALEKKVAELEGTRAFIL